MKPSHVLLLLAGLLAASSVFAGSDAPRLSLDAETRFASLAGHMALHVDAPGTLTFEQAAQAEYTPLAGFRSAGYTSDTHWYRFTLNADGAAPRDWILALGMPYLDDVQVWVMQANTPPRFYSLGDHVPYQQRTLKSRLFTLPLEMTDTSPVQVYVRVHTISAMNLTAEIWRPADFIANETRVNFYNGLYFGILAIIVIFYLIIGSWLRDAGMLVYSVYVGTLFMSFFGLNGYTAVVFAPQTPWIGDAVQGSSMIGGLAIAPILQGFLIDLRKNSPLINRCFYMLSLVCICALPFAASSYYRVVAPVMLRIGMGYTFLNPVLALWIFLRLRIREHLLYFFAFIASIIGFQFQALMSMGVLPNNVLLTSGYQAASLIHVLLMSFGLAMRIRTIQYGKVVAEQAAAISDQRISEQRRFVAMLSHEFRNPLAAIDRAAQMLRIKQPNMAQPEAGRVDNIRGHAAALSSLVDNFLMSEALDHKELAPAREQCAIRPLLEEVLQTLGVTPGGRVTLTVTPPDAAFSLDPTLMGMAVGNLLDNALRYTPPDARVELSATVDADGLVIHVSDQGPGMSKEELAMLGTPYYRGASSSGKKGSGLGFHFSRKVAEAHGGSLQASLPSVGGMDFAFRIPRR